MVVGAGKGFVVVTGAGFVVVGAAGGGFVVVGGLKGARRTWVSWGVISVTAKVTIVDGPLHIAHVQRYVSYSCWLDTVSKHCLWHTWEHDSFATTSPSWNHV